MRRWNMRWTHAVLSAAVVLVSAVALAETDTFNLGTGRDGASTVSAAGTGRDVTVDSMAPARPVVVFPAANAVIATATPTFSGTAEPSSEVLVRIFRGETASGTADASGSWSITLTTALEEYPYTAFVTATDEAGNQSDTTEVEFTVDLTAPDTKLDSTPASASTSADASFSFSAVDDGPATFECALDSDSFTACSSPAHLTVSNGEHVFKVRARDAAGNVDVTPATFSWRVDTGAPDVTITEKPASVTHTTSATFVFGSTDSGSSFECSVDGAAFASCSSPVSLSGLSEATHSFKVQARDVAGNVSTAPATWEWTVDATAPAAPVLTAPTEGQTFESGTPAIAGTAEAGSQVRISINGSEVGSVSADGSGNWSFTPATALASGSYTVKATATDAAGNTSAESGARTFKVAIRQPSGDGDGSGGGETEGCGCSSPAGDPASALMALAGLAAYVSRRRRK